MSLPLAGALACWLSVSAMLLAPQLRLPRVRLGRDHPDAAALHDAGWARPLWQWEAARGVIALVSIAIALTAGRASWTRSASGSNSRPRRSTLRSVASA